MRTYNGSVWANNGPHMLTRVFHEHCKLPINNVSEVDFRCDALDMQIYPDSKAYPIYCSPKEIAKYFDPKTTDEVLKTVKNAHFVHFTSSMSSKMTVTKNSKVAYRFLAERSCPKIYEVSDFNFE
jgi:hypothetical protein